MKVFRVVLDNESQADVIVSMFEQEGIPFTVVSHFNSAYDGLFQMSTGWGHLEIPEEFRARAEEVMNNYRESLGQ